MGIFTRNTDNHNKTRYNLYTDTCNAFTINLTALYRYSCNTYCLIFVNIEYNRESESYIDLCTEEKDLYFTFSKPAPTQTAVAYQYNKRDKWLEKEKENANCNALRSKRR